MCTIARLLAYAAGVIVIAGTGSVVHGTAEDGRSWTLGGWGYLFGDEGSAFWLVREALAGAIEVHEANSLEDAVSQAFALARPSGVVLLAPACSSFDMFRDYADRGRRFKENVRKLA